MASYIHGSLAVEERNRELVKVKERKKTIYKRSVISPQEKLLYLVAIIICLVVAGAIIFRYAQIYEMNTKIQQIESEIKKIEAENSTLRLEVAKLQDNKRLMDIGTQLGFTPSEAVTEISIGQDKADNDLAMAQ